MDDRAVKVGYWCRCGVEFGPNAPPKSSLLTCQQFRPDGSLAREVRTCTDCGGIVTETRYREPDRGRRS